MSDRAEIIDLIRNEYDPKPDLPYASDWDDGARRIADAILADRVLLLRKYADRIEALEAALQSIVQWSDTYPVGHVTDHAGKIAHAALDKDAGT